MTAEKKTVRVFVSHKHEDKETALLLKRKLELYGGERVKCFVSEKIPYGSDWFEQIRANLAKTDLLLLLFTVTDASWDWPLYEVGLATSLADPGSCRVVCLYSPFSKPPDPIKYTQAVKADQQGIEDFLHMFFTTSEITGIEPPINIQFRDDRSELASLAKELSKGFGGVEPWSHYFTNFLWIIVDSVPLESEEVPEGAKICVESSALEMFRLTSAPPGRQHWTWGELLGKVNQSTENQWVRDLGERFYWASRGEILKTTKSTVRCMRTGQHFRPLLHKVELRPDNSMLFEVIFVVHLPSIEATEVDGGEAN